MRSGSRQLALISFGLAIPAIAVAEPQPRTPLISGQIVQTRIGEDISFIETPALRPLEIGQDVKAGDVVRTNEIGQVALVFADRTQVRVGRNSVLVVKDVRADGGVSLELRSGQLYGRAARGGSGVTVETPAATAAIRGTDWAMTVVSERTTLSVIEGLVDLSNASGLVSVGTGEAAVATLGGAPSKIVIAGGDIRQQMLYNLSLREAFGGSGIVKPRRNGADEEASGLTPETPVSTQDMVAAAEISFELYGKAGTIEAIAAARKGSLSAAQQARLDYLEGRMLAGARRYAEAAALLDRAQKGLSGEDRISAGYLAYFAHSLANPTVVHPKPRPVSASFASLMGEETIAAMLKSPRDAMELLQQAEPRFGGDIRLQIAIAERAMQTADFGVALRAIRKAEQIDQRDPALLHIRAQYRSHVEGDVRGAVRDLEAATDRSPGRWEYWLSLGQEQVGRLATREAEAAYRKALELDPDAPETLASYAGLLLYAGRNDEARHLVDQALADDSSFELALYQRGRAKLQSGDPDGGLDDMLRATAANPTYGRGLIALGATYAARGEMEPAAQSFELADRLDPTSPIMAQYRALLELYNYELDQAIELGQESVKRARARGGDYSSVEASDDFGSTLGGIYRTASLNAWARYWGDRAFDPFQGASYFDQNLTGSVSPFATARGLVAVTEPNTGDDAAFSGYIQGALLDPLAIVSPRRRPAFYRFPFQETEIGVGMTTMGRDIQLTGSASYQKLGYDPLPYALTTDLTYLHMNPSFADQTAQNLTSLTVFGAQLTPDDRIVGYLNGGHVEGGVSIDGAISDGHDVTRRDTLNADGLDMFLGWSHTFEYRNVLNVGLFSTILDRSGRDSLVRYSTDGDPIGEDSDVDEDEFSMKLGVSHLFEVADDVTLRWGLEGGQSEYEVSSSLFRYFIFDPTINVRDPAITTHVEGENVRAWIGGMAKLTPDVEVEANLFVDWYNQNDVEDTSFNPHVGIAWEVTEGQYLRAAYAERTPLSERSTLSPLTIVGLRADNPPAFGETKTAMMRWDAEWTDRFFTAVEYQHQEIENLSVGVPVYNYALNLPEARIDRLTFNANLWIGGGVTFFANYSRIWGGNPVPDWNDWLPTVPEHTGRIGFSYMSPERFTFFVAESYIGKRVSFTTDVHGASRETVWMDDAFVTDIGAGWESEDRHLSLSFSVSNVFDEDVDVAPLVPGPGRMFSASIRGRF
ncbi:TonB-dependent receptor [Shinella curvata]|uniref:TonB-dependent receptor n=1 Tax=Shinella curvata TaxID=1817964 RepID=A0ABT8XBJ4_9HYPH|nr:TonB-dependent receptor [Shinella curvata]MCJ8054792.1 TonB-dependent receptor [Shinella curvata]MDO6120813.1 TonB-dependent receptor [Shinella curvata]